MQGLVGRTVAGQTDTAVQLRWSGDRLLEGATCWHPVVPVRGTEMGPQGLCVLLGQRRCGQTGEGQAWEESLPPPPPAKSRREPGLFLRFRHYLIIIE